MSPACCQGKVIEYAVERGYGRIMDQEQREFFVHFRDLKSVDALRAGQSVRFVPVLHRKGNIAREVQPL